jgi:RNA polymerase sigma-70 factor (ECF subfamily)
MASIERPNDPASRAFRRFREHSDPAAMTEVFDLVGQELFALAAHIARDAAEAEDLVQELFLAALAGARRFDTSRAVTPWLVGILVKEARKARRGRARREGPRAERLGLRAEHDGADDGTQRAAPPTAAPLAMALSGEVRFAITRALEGVPERYRDVLRPVLEDGVAPITLAATLGRAPGTVRAQLHRGLELLRKALPHTLAPALVPPLVSALALELGAGRGLASIRADLARRAALEGPGLALAGAGVLVTPSLPLLGVFVMQTKVLAALALTALVGVALLLQRDERAQPTLEPAPALVAPTETSLAGAANARPDSTPEPFPSVRSAVAIAEPDDVTASDDGSSTATLAVRVVDEMGVGVQSAYVTLKPSEAELEAARRKGGSLEYSGAQGDTSGWVTLQVPAGRALELECANVGSRSSSGNVAVEALEAGASAEALIRVRTRPDTEVHGRVVDGATGAPLGGIAVHVSEKSGQSSRTDPLPPLDAPHAVTDVNGEFRAPARSWLTMGALFTGPGWSPRVAWLRSAGEPAGGNASTQPTSAMEIALQPSARIEGTVSCGRAGLVVRAKVSNRELLQDSSDIGRRFRSIDGFGRDFELTAIVDERGEFDLNDVPAAAAVQLTLTEENRRALKLQEPSPVRIDSGSTHIVAWTLLAGGRFVCTVRETNGDAVANEVLWLVPASDARPGKSEGHWNPSQRAHTDESGVAAFEDVQPGRWVIALAPAQKVGGEASDSARYAIAATIESGGEVVPVELTLYRDLWIKGRIVAPDGSPCASSIMAMSGGYFVNLQRNEVEGGVFRVVPRRRAWHGHGRPAPPRGIRPAPLHRRGHGG